MKHRLRTHETQHCKTAYLPGVLFVLLFVTGCQNLIDDFEVKPGSKPILKYVGYAPGPVFECSFIQNILPVGQDNLTVIVKNLTSIPIDSATLLFSIYEKNIYEAVNLKIVHSVRLLNIPAKQNANDTILLSSNYNAILDPELLQVTLVSLRANTYNNLFHGLYKGNIELFSGDNTQVHFSTAPAGGSVDYNGFVWFTLAGDTNIKVIKGNLHPGGRFTGTALDGSGEFLSSVQTDSLMPAVLLPNGMLQMDLDLNGTSNIEITKRLKINFINQR